jgi:CRP-like cAMP-binding protein
MVQGEAGVCYRMPAPTFRHEMERSGPFFQAVMRYQAAFTALVIQVTACNGLHSVEQRLARWLLMAQDHLGENDFALTQEFAAMMLGATRPTVTIVAGTLQRAGLITYRRGRVQIVDRERLEDASCECYAASRKLLQRTGFQSAAE